MTLHFYSFKKTKFEHSMDEKTDNWQLYLMFLTNQFIQNDKKKLN